MRHYKKGRKLGTDASHTKAMKKNLAVALFTNDRIKTTVPRAKEVRGTVERIITWAKKGDLHSRRLAIAALGDKELVREVFEKVEQGMWADRNGGYTRILKLGPRKGDNAPMAILELVEEAVTPKAKADEKPAKTSKKSAAKKATKSEDKAVDGIEGLIEEGTEDKNDNDKDDIEEFAEGEADRIDAIAETDVREDAVEAEKAEDEESVEDAILEAKEAEVAKTEAENIEKIKEEIAEEERELIDDVNPLSKEEHAIEDADEKAEKHEDDE